MERLRKNVRIGLVGAGHLGKIHAKNLVLQKNAEFTGYFDTDKDISLPIECLNQKAYESLDSLLLENDAIVIATPTPFHASIAELAMQHGKHCFIEKPITETAKAAMRLIDIANSQDLILQVGHVERFNPAWSQLTEPIQNPKFIEAHRLAPFTDRSIEIAVVLDLMIHELDLILYLVDSSVQSIQASGVAVVTDQTDIANARITFQNGCVANLTASRISAKTMRKMRIFQSKKYIAVDMFKKVLEEFRLEDITSDGFAKITDLPTQNGTKQLSVKRTEISSGNAIFEEQAEFIRSIQAQSLPKVTGKDGMRALDVALQIDKIIHANHQ